MGFMAPKYNGGEWLCSKGILCFYYIGESRQMGNDIQQRSLARWGQCGSWSVH